jgi:hypothetical protein
MKTKPDFKFGDRVVLINNGQKRVSRKRAARRAGRKRDRHPASRQSLPQNRPPRHVYPVHLENGLRDIQSARLTWFILALLRLNRRSGRGMGGRAAHVIRSRPSSRMWIAGLSAVFAGGES